MSINEKDDSSDYEPSEADMILQQLWNDSFKHKDNIGIISHEKSIEDLDNLISRFENINISYYIEHRGPLRTKYNELLATVNNLPLATISSKIENVTAYLLNSIVG